MDARTSIHLGAAAGLGALIYGLGRMPDYLLAAIRGDSLAGPLRSFGASLYEFAAVLVLGPVIETGVLAVFGALLLGSRWSFAGPAFVAFVGLGAWAAHGADALALGRGLAFTALALAFWRWRSHSGMGWAFGLTLLAHEVWNGLLLASRVGASP